VEATHEPEPLPALSVATAQIAMMEEPMIRQQTPTALVRAKTVPHNRISISTLMTAHLQRKPFLLVFCNNHLFLSVILVSLIFLLLLLVGMLLTMLLLSHIH